MYTKRFKLDKLKEKFVWYWDLLWFAVFTGFLIWIMTTSCTTLQRDTDIRLIKCSDACYPSGMLSVDRHKCVCANKGVSVQ